MVVLNKCLNSKFFAPKLSNNPTGWNIQAIKCIDGLGEVFILYFTFGFYFNRYLMVAKKIDPAGSHFIPVIIDRQP